MRLRARACAASRACANVPPLNEFSGSGRPRTPGGDFDMRLSRARAAWPGSSALGSSPRPSSSRQRPVDVGRPGRAAGRHRPGPGRDEPVPHRVLHRLGGLRPQLPGPGGLRPRTPSRSAASPSRGPRTGTTWTFKIDPNLKWSDGTPATSADALWTLQTLLDQQKSGRGYAGVGYLDLYLTYAAVTSVTRARPADARPRRPTPEHADPDLVPADPAEAHLGEARHQHRPEQGAGRGDRPLSGRGVEDRRIRPVGPQPQLPGPERSPTRTRPSSSSSRTKPR